MVSPGEFTVNPHPEISAFVPKNENIGIVAIRVIKTLQLFIQACILDMYK